MMERENSEILSTAKWIAVALVAGYVAIKALEKWNGELPPLVRIGEEPRWKLGR